MASWKVSPVHSEQWGHSLIARVGGQSHSHARIGSLRGHYVRSSAARCDLQCKVAGGHGSTSAGAWIETSFSSWQKLLYTRVCL